MRLNRKGYLTVEIVLASAVCFAIAFFLMDITVKLVSRTDDVYRETIVSSDSSIVTRNIKSEVNKILNDRNNSYVISNVSCESDSKCTIIFKDDNGNSISNSIIVDSSSIKYMNNSGSVVYSKNMDNSISDMKIYSNISGDVSENDSVYLKIVLKNIFTGKEYVNVIPVMNPNNIKYVPKKYTLRVYRKLGNNTSSLYDTYSDIIEGNSITFTTVGEDPYLTYNSVSCDNGHTTTRSGNNFTINGVMSDVNCTVSYVAGNRTVNIKSNIGSTTTTVASNVSVAYNGNSSYYTIKGTSSYPSYKGTSCTNGQQYEDVVYNSNNGIDSVEVRLKNVTQNTTCTVTFGTRSSSIYIVNLYRDGEFVGKFEIEKNKSFRTGFNAPITPYASCTNGQKAGIVKTSGFNYEIYINSVTSDTRCDIDY